MQNICNHQQQNYMFRFYYLIMDYLPMPEYVCADALLYWKCKKISANLEASAGKLIRDAFTQHSHNAFCLIEGLPKDFLQKQSLADLEDSLHFVQMDWLLASPAGLLFRLREELYGLLEGYDQIFWPELESAGHKVAHSLSVNCELCEHDLSATDQAA